MNEAKKLRTYVDEVQELSSFSSDNITVEHRSNNPKRDFLFVNRAQCKHIPCSATAMITMCNKLADIVRERLFSRDKVLIVAFAETATAIGNILADAIPQCRLVIQTTRENLSGYDKLFEFSEEHSHAVEQSLYVSTACSLEDIDYVLLVDDEITTGRTACNFIKQFEAWLEKKANKKVQYGIASICNWQCEESRSELSEQGIDIFALITGTIKDSRQKMLVGKITHYLTLALEYKERLEHTPNQDLSQLYLAVDTLNLKGRSIRIIGTEEFMYVPIKVAEYLEARQFVVTCHSTTRSPIDVISEDSADLNFKLCLPSVYDASRLTYLYNTGEHTDVAILITDGTELAGAVSVLAASLRCDQFIIIHLKEST